MSGKTELLPCPFCGGEAHMSASSDGYGVQCWNRRCIDMQMEEIPTEAEAIAAWNARAERGTLTAEQVREAVMSADRWEKPMGNTGLTNTHLIIRDDGWQEIADELNARAERTCEACAFSKPTDLTDGCAALERIAELEREISTLKEHRAANMEKLHELTDECAELRKYRDEWRGLAEKYRADSIAAQEETERYRAKLGDVLDAIHEAERAVR